MAAAASSAGAAAPFPAPIIGSYLTRNYKPDPKPSGFICGGFFLCVSDLLLFVNFMF
jgi:hypothetical protein